MKTKQQVTYFKISIASLWRWNTVQTKHSKRNMSPGSTDPTVNAPPQNFSLHWFCTDQHISQSVNFVNYPPGEVSSFLQTSSDSQRKWTEEIKSCDGSVSFQSKMTFYRGMIYQLLTAQTICNLLLMDVLDRCILKPDPRNCITSINYKIWAWIFMPHCHSSMRGNAKLSKRNKCKQIHHYQQI